MIPNAKQRNVQSHGVSQSASFGISAKDSAHIMTILRDTLYSDKVLAVLREYSSNAWDANREAGKGDTPIKVTIPTHMNPTLIIEDEGPGLSHDDVFQVYTQYGASTKRDSDTAVGMLGIGSKSGFAYSDSFTIVSKHQGKSRTYVAVLDESNAGAINLLYEEDCPQDETGISVQLPVRPDDVEEFVSTAKSLFQYFEPRPEINIDIPQPPPEEARLSNGRLLQGANEWIAVMGCVPYRINIQQLKRVDPKTSNGGLGDYVHKISGILYFNIGEVEINASREELKYSDNTKLVLVKKINELIDEFVTATITDISAAKISPWEKRLRAKVFADMGLPVPDPFKKLSAAYLKFSPKGGSYSVAPSGRINRKGNIEFYSTEVNIYIRDDVSFVIKDAHKNMRGYAFRGTNYIVKPMNGASPEDTEKALHKDLEDLGLTGVPVTYLSKIDWHPIVNGREIVKKSNKKHKVRSFRLKDKRNYGHPWSDGWEAVTREPTKDDVYVIVSLFKPRYDFYRMYKKDKELAEHFGVPMPEIYGYKTTPKKPVDENDLKGTEYRKWRKIFHKSLIADKKIAANISHILWGLASTGCPQLARYRGPRTSRQIGQRYRFLRVLRKELGKTHPITVFYSKQVKSQGKCRRFDDKTWSLLLSLKDLEEVEDDCLKEFNDLLERYPLFTSTYEDGLSALWDSNHEVEWQRYIRMADSYAAGANP